MHIVGIFFTAYFITHAQLIQSIKGIEANKIIKNSSNYQIKNEIRGTITSNQTESKYPSNILVIFDGLILHCF